MKIYIKIAIAAFVLFILVNTAYFWEGQLGLWAIPVTLALIIYAVILVGLFIQQLAVAFKEKFTGKRRLLSLLLQLLILLSVCFVPTGIIDFDRLSGKDVFVAEREGAANCLTTLKLKDNGIFIQRQVCFGINEIKGNYIIKNDTIFFINITHNREVDSFYSYAVLKPSVINGKKKITADLFEYYNKTDTTGYPLWVAKNDLIDCISCIDTVLYQLP